MVLTKKQRRVMDYIGSFQELNGYSPSYEEIADGLGYRSKGTVHKHLKHLVEKGMITKQWNRSRSIEIVSEPSEIKAVNLPLLGLVAAGEPIVAIEDPTEEISVPGDMIGFGSHYVLKVRGNSMIDEQIRDGDYVIVEERSNAESGETVVALVGGDEATIKKFYPENGKIRLQPANEKMLPLILPADSVQIRGVVIGILRKYL
ncbi:MAG: transcriptional repressor LexA [Candidatus Marinimicrobia bacterium]|nr:transcriptional repressor LexA [Candidatus Neomarinimicrobiota bacterium]